MNLGEQIRKVHKVIHEELDEPVGMPEFRHVGEKRYVIHKQADGTERVFDMLTGKEIIEGEVV